MEDDAAVRDLAARILKMRGYALLEAGSGGEALEACARHAGPIHLLVTDVVMPCMSGRELAGRLSASRPGTKVLYLSGYTASAIAHHGVLEPGAAFLPKPFTPEGLVRAVREALGPARAGQ